MFRSPARLLVKRRSTASSLSTYFSKIQDYVYTTKHIVKPVRQKYRTGAQPCLKNRGCPSSFPPSLLSSLLSSPPFLLPLYSSTSLPTSLHFSPLLSFSRGFHPWKPATVSGGTMWAPSAGPGRARSSVSFGGFWGEKGIMVIGDSLVVGDRLTDLRQYHQR